MVNMKFQSTKIFDGYSTVFRQWRAEGTHCRFLHGYGISFKIVFEGDLDERNWVWDFGGMKRAKNKIDGMNPKEWMDFMFDHTYLIAEDDPFLPKAMEMFWTGIVQLRVVPATGAEQFAKFIYEKVSKFIKIETDNRVRVVSVEFMEHNKNTAIYGE
jgi:6-pyruvoyltetrahydropterin/6-carboxytetrahydropterin synthase